MLWRDYLLLENTGWQNVSLFMQWCLYVSIAERVEDIQSWCDWRRLRVRIMLPRNNQETFLPEAIQIGNHITINYFNILLVRSEGSATDSMLHGKNEDAAKSRGAFTTMLHTKNVMHIIQMFLREFIRLTMETPCPVYNSIVRLIRFSTWTQWKCNDCKEWIMVLREIQQKCPHDSVFTLDDWLSISMATDPTNNNNYHPVMYIREQKREEYRDVIISGACAFYQELQGILQHTNLESNRTGILQQCVRLLEETKLGDDGDRSIELCIREMSVKLKSWLIQNMKFIPFSRIDFIRLCYGLYVFRFGPFIPNTLVRGKDTGDHKFFVSRWLGGSEERHNDYNDYLLDPKFMYDMLCIYIEKEDHKCVAKGVRPVSDADKHMEWWWVFDTSNESYRPYLLDFYEALCEYHPMHRCITSVGGFPDTFATNGVAPSTR